ncbi:Arv1-like family-domain-containing protein [Rhodotorula toruloides]
MAHVAPVERPKANYECIHCSSPTPSLYIKYSDPSNTSLVQCSTCSRIADIYQSFDFPVLLLDLLLLKPEVYRHLLRNHGGTSSLKRVPHQARESLRLGTIVLGADAREFVCHVPARRFPLITEAVVRCVGAQAHDESDSLLLYFRTLGYCLIETLSLLLSIGLASRLVAPQSVNGLALIPLTSFYASLPTIFFLVVSSVIWRAEYLPAPTNDTPSSFLLDKLDTLYEQGKRLPTSTGIDSRLSTIAYLTSFSRANLRSGLAQVGEARGWASEALLRKGIGGTSALVAFSGAWDDSRLTHAGSLLHARAVLLRCSKRRAAMVLLLAWLLHLVLLHAVDPLLL